MLKSKLKSTKNSSKITQKPPSTHQKTLKKPSKLAKKVTKTLRKTEKNPKKTEKITKTTKKSPKTPKYPKFTKNALETYSREKLEQSLKIDAKALNIPIGAAEIFIEKTLDAVEKSLGPKQIITDRDLTSAIAKELKQYNADFAYIYQNRDKIV